MLASPALRHFLAREIVLPYRLAPSLLHQHIFVVPFDLIPLCSPTILAPLSLGHFSALKIVLPHNSASSLLQIYFFSS